MKDKKPEEEVTLDWNELFEEEELMKNDLWNVKFSEDKLSEKKKNVHTEENMQKKEMSKKTKIVQKGKNKLSKRKMSQGRVSEEKEKNELSKGNMSQEEVSEESEDWQSGKVESGVVVAEKTQKNDLKEPSWGTPHLNFGTPKLKPSQLKFAKREVSKRESPKKEMPPKLKLEEKMPKREILEKLENKFDKKV